MNMCNGDMVITTFSGYVNKTFKPGSITFCLIVFAVLIECKHF